VRNYSDKIIAEEEGLNIHQRYDLVIPEKTVDRIMGPEPVPTIEICAEEIQNELQKKLVDEYLCALCN